MSEQDNTTIPLKVCGKCKCIYPATTDHFYPLRKGLKSICKKCELEYHKNRRPEHTPRTADRIALTAQGMKRCTTCKQAYPATIDYFHAERRTWDGLHTKCKICTNADHARYCAEHSQHIRDISKIWRTKNNNSMRESKMRWRHKNPDKARAIVHRRRALRNKSEVSSVPFDEKDQYKRQKGRCYYCHKQMKVYEVEHIIPLSRGGSDHPDNKVLTCQHCNRSKCNKLPHEWSKGGRLL